MNSSLKTLDTAVPPDVYTEEYFLTDAEGKEEYVETNGRELSPRLARSMRIADVKPGMRILDLGHGRGEVVYHCALRGAHATGIDYSDTARRLAERLIGSLPVTCRGNAELIKGDIRSLPFANEHFDRVTMLDIVEHLAPPELDMVLCEVFRVLKKDGKCLIHTMPNKLFWEVGYRYYMKWLDAAIRLILQGETSVKHEGRNHYSLMVHVNEQSCSSLKKLLRHHGFTGKVWLEDDFFNRKNWQRCSWKELTYEAMMRLWPVSSLWPLNQIFHHTLYAVVGKKG
jgi:cyclopropane fatty-acyl-phospholipid synthase-like methyltransferase